MAVILKGVGTVNCGTDLAFHDEKVFLRQNCIKLNLHVCSVNFLTFCLFRLVDDIDMRFIRYTGCGKNVPKANKLSPDAFVQIGMQLAYFR